ncbi:unnamed protein product [Paramecium primaurelia]|uniref:Transmembrane protein n=1 Tax=Paramecium primaurelia TaxID=5886 RepID=A0A8S1L4F2_PARPR|nr:unnamed protein product [Paramecium primaurelia]
MINLNMDYVKKIQLDCQQNLVILDWIIQNQSQIFGINYIRIFLILVVSISFSKLKKYPQLVHLLKNI